MPTPLLQTYTLTSIGTAFKYTDARWLHPWRYKGVVLLNGDSVDPVVDAVVEGSMDGTHWNTLNNTFGDALAAGTQAAVQFDDPWVYYRVGVKAADANPLSLVTIWISAKD